MDTVGYGGIHARVPGAVELAIGKLEDLELQDLAASRFRNAGEGGGYPVRYACQKLESS